MTLGPGSPRVYLVDASEENLDEVSLRATARVLSEGWPYSSRSYCFPFALIALHEDRVGVDIEQIVAWSGDEVCSILTPAERDIPRRPRTDFWATSIWSSKEAAAKAFGDATRYDPRRLESPLFWPQGEAGRWRASTLPVPADHVAWLCWLPIRSGPPFFQPPVPWRRGDDSCASLSSTSVKP